LILGQPFVDACFKNGNILESSKPILIYNYNDSDKHMNTEKYILKSDANLRAEMYIKLGLFIEASEAAFLARDIRTLVELRDKYRNRVQLNDLDRMINELRIK
jgi:hypothetical protein